jgi:hypothetical protein
MAQLHPDDQTRTKGIGYRVSGGEDTLERITLPEKLELFVTEPGPKRLLLIGCKESIQLSSVHCPDYANDNRTGGTARHDAWQQVLLPQRLDHTKVVHAWQRSSGFRVWGLCLLGRLDHARVEREGFSVYAWPCALENDAHLACVSGGLNRKYLGLHHR